MTDVDPSLEPFVSPAAFLPLPSPLPLDGAAAKHLPSTQLILKRSFTLSDLADQADPMDFCISFGCYKLLEEYTRSTLPTLSPPHSNLAPRIFHIWAYRLAALVALNLAPLAAREAHSLNFVSHPLTPPSLRLATASLHALAGDPLAALQELASITHNSNYTVDHPTLILGAFRDMISIAAWSLMDPRLVDHLLAQALAIQILSRLSPLTRQAWWAHIALAYLTVLQMTHAEWAVGVLESEAGSGASLVQYVRACILSHTNRSSLASSAWSSLTSQVSATAARIRAYEMANPEYGTWTLSDRIPIDLFPPPDSTTVSMPSATTYAEDVAWLTPLVPVVQAVANNMLVAKVYAHGSKDNDMTSSFSAIVTQTTLPTEEDWVKVVKIVRYADAAMVSNLSIWLEVAPIGGVESTLITTDETTVTDRKRAILRDMIKETDAGAVTSLRLV